MKQELSCREVSESLMECARQHLEPGGEASAHLAECEGCTDRWVAERRLAAGLGAMRRQSARVRSPRALRETLMDEFVARQTVSPKVRPIRRSWMLGFAAAAAFLVSTVVVRNLTIPSAGTLASASDHASEQSEAQQDGFIEVPYAPPLAPGEMIRVVHTELQPAALASLGVNVDPSWNTELPADLLVGQDGFPRAVRVSDDYAGVGGF